MDCLHPPAELFSSTQVITLIKRERLLATASCRTEMFNYLLLLKVPAYIAYVVSTYMCAFPSTFYYCYLFAFTLRTRVFCTVLVSVAGQV